MPLEVRLLFLERIRKRAANATTDAKRQTTLEEVLGWRVDLIEHHVGASPVGCTVR